MKINQIIINETSAGATASGSVATVSSPLGKTQSRASIYGDQKVGNLLKGKKTSKPYANSLNESRIGELDHDLKNMKPAEFKKKYGKTREEMLASFRKPEQQKSQQVPVSEADLNEEDKIIAVGKGNKLKPGLLSKPENSINPTDTVKIDVPLLIRLLEYAKEDANSDMDLHDLAEKLVDKARRGKTLTMKDYESVIDEVAPGGVVAGGISAESPLQKAKTQMSKPRPATRDEIKGLVPMSKSHVIAPDKMVYHFQDPALKQFSKQEWADLKNQLFVLRPQKPTAPATPAKPQKPTAPAKPQSVLNRVRGRMQESQLDEKFASQQQAKLMYAAAGDKDVAKKTGVSQKVAKEFVKKSHGQKVSKLPKKVAKKD